MQRQFGVTVPSVHQMVLTLERLGLVTREAGVARSIDLLIAPEDLPASETETTNPSNPLCGDTRRLRPEGCSSLLHPLIGSNQPCD